MLLSFKVVTKANGRENYLLVNDQAQFQFGALFRFEIFQAAVISSGQFLRLLNLETTGKTLSK